MSLAAAMETQSLEALFATAAARKGGAAAFEVTLATPASPKALAKLPDDRWLSAMSKSIFQAGFNWKLIETKWPRFEEVFAGFDVHRMAVMSDDDLDGYLKTEGIVRHPTKIRSIQENAQFLRTLETEQGRGGQAIARWPTEDFSGLLWMLKKQGSRLGGTTAMYFLRGMGVDGFILSRDVVRALIREGVVDKDPSARRDLERVQQAFNRWHAESGRPFMHISRILACSVE